MVPRREGPHPALGSALARTRNEAWLGDLSPVTLASIAVSLIVVVVVGSMSLFSTPRRAEVPPYSAERVVTDSPAATTEPEPEPPPAVSYSPAPVFLSSRQAAPTRSHAPTRRATPSARPTGPKPSASPPPPAPRPGELVPLPASQEPSLRSAGGGPETFVDFVNARSEPVVVYWLDYGGQRQPYASLQPGQGYRQQTYVGHPWVVTDTRGMGLACFLPADQTLRAVIR
ncbi:von Hippel-Lindau disease tumour suppressor protein [Micromonospora auratinigra]|uniref:von Hippel-Lindau disease tumour suppressor protein n=2 Tax=Micromonospora auratinigra TaxID=261654 RepID=A0A1A9A384_9ACTN|nr:von Hippel-Lindau disease tumour suppressor protein [Micromonospora auratinigra]